jgi:hypothetical protein
VTKTAKRRSREAVDFTTLVLIDSVSELRSCSLQSKFHGKCYNLPGFFSCIGSVWTSFEGAAIVARASRLATIAAPSNDRESSSVDCKPTNKTFRLHVKFYVRESEQRFATCAGRGCSPSARYFCVFWQHPRGQMAHVNSRYLPATATPQIKIVIYSIFITNM